MAVNKVAKETSFSIEVKKGVDKSGDPIFTKKTFSNVKNDADPQNIYDVADAIENVLAADAGGTFINVTSNLVVA